MIDKSQITDLFNQFAAEHNGIELINLAISADNVISIDVDSCEGVDLDTCALLNRFINDRLSREVEDYELEVGSVSLTDPFRTLMQYHKHLGHQVEVLLPDGQKLEGQLVEVNDDNFSIDAEEMIKIEGKKRRQKQIVTRQFAYDDVKWVRYLLKV